METEAVLLVICFVQEDKGVTAGFETENGRVV
jgi:hypothetical protein